MVQPEFTVEIYAIKPRLFRETLLAIGSLRANEAVNLRAERAGIVKEVHFEEGRPVKAGDVLVQIDDSELRAQLAAAEARLNLARTVEARDRSLFESKMLSAADYERSRANLHVIESDLDLIKAQLEKTRIIAPFDGLMGLRQISPGAYLVAGTAIASLQDIASLKLDFTLPERYLPMLKPGQKATFQVSGRTEVFEAVIHSIEPAVSIETRSLQLRATAPNPTRILFPGSFAEVQVILDEDPNAILIPPIALIPGLKEQKVFVHRNGVVAEREVEIGLRTSDRVQILKGLQAGDELITSGILQLRPGMKVRTKARNFDVTSTTNTPSQPGSLQQTQSVAGGAR